MKPLSVRKNIMAAWLLLALAVSAPLPAEESVTHLSDRQISHQIHSDVVADSSLPYGTHLIKVRAKDGKVTLEGEVFTEEQKALIEKKAVKVAGDENVTNQITIKG